MPTRTTSMRMGAERKLTVRQVAVLAAVERYGRTDLPGLHGDFPDLAPSTVARVLQRLVELGLVITSGNPSVIYTGGVDFWPASRQPPAVNDELDAIVRELCEHADGPHGRLRA